MGRPTHIVHIPVRELNEQTRRWDRQPVRLPGLDSPPDFIEVFSPKLKAVTFFPEAWIEPLPQPAPRRGKNDG